MTRIEHGIYFATMTPAHWPPRYNGYNDPCDTIDGPCCCGAWHVLGEEWVTDHIDKFGYVVCN